MTTNDELMKKIERLLEKNAALEVMLALLMKEVIALTNENKTLMKENLGQTIETLRLLIGNVGQLKGTVGLMKEKEALQQALWEEKNIRRHISLN